MNKAYFGSIDEAITYAINQKWTGYRIRREVSNGGVIMFSVERDERDFEGGNTGGKSR